VVTRLRATVQGRTSVTTRTSELQREGAKTVGAGERQVRAAVAELLAESGRERSA